MAKNDLWKKNWTHWYSELIFTVTLVTWSKTPFHYGLAHRSGNSHYCPAERPTLALNAPNNEEKVRSSLVLKMHDNYIYCEAWKYNLSLILWIKYILFIGQCSVLLREGQCPDESAPTLAKTVAWQFLGILKTLAGSSIKWIEAKLCRVVAL